MKNAKIRNFLFVLSLLAIFAIPIFTFAQPVGNQPNPTGCVTCNADGSSPVPGAVCNPIKACDLPRLIKTILEGIIKIGIPIIALAIVYCGFLFVQARGAPAELQKAKDALMYTLIGAAILLGSWAIAMLISETILAL